RRRSSSAFSSSSGMFVSFRHENSICRRSGLAQLSKKNAGPAVVLYAICRGNLLHLCPLSRAKRELANRNSVGAIEGETKKTHNVQTKLPDEYFLMPSQSLAG